MNRAKKIATVGYECVACGVCTKHCPLAALSVNKGLYAAVNHEKCVGCGKCATVCSAGVIDVVSREADAC